MENTEVTEATPEDLLAAESEVVDRNIQEWAEEGVEPKPGVIVVNFEGTRYDVKFNGIEMDAVPLKLEKAAKVLRRALMENT